MKLDFGKDFSLRVDNFRFAVIRPESETSRSES